MREIKILVFFILLLIPQVGFAMDRAIDSTQIIGEYTLTKASEQQLIKVGMKQMANSYKTLYILQNVDSIEIEPQHLPGIPLVPTTTDPYTFQCKEVNALIKMRVQGKEHATGFHAQMGDFDGTYKWEDQGKFSIDRPSSIFQYKNPEKHGLDSKKLIEASIKISSGVIKNIHSLLIIKNGDLVFEEYYNGSNVNHNHQIRSAGKSITSIAIGIAIDKGYISGVDEKVFDYFSEEAPLGGRESKKQYMTIEHLLTMTSGFDCDDWREPKFECANKMTTTKNWGQFALNLPMSHHPGTHWAYNGTALMILSDLIKKTTGEKYQEFLNTHLMKPLGIKSYVPLISPLGNAYTGGSAKMTARDMAKIGYLFLKKGNWFGNQVVSSAWVDQSSKFSVETSSFHPYGYLWWRGQRTVNGLNIETFYAAGNGGQNIFVFPSLDMVVVFTGGNYGNKLTNQIFGLLSKHVIAASVPQKAKPKILELSQDTITSYTGIYEKKNIKFYITKNGNSLYWNNKPGDFKKTRMYPLSENLFILPSNNYDHSFIKFQFDLQKQLSGLIWHNKWRSFFLKRE